MKIIILSLSPYQEKDAIVNAISEEEYLTFKVHGLYSNNSKNKSLNNVLTIADVEINKSQKTNNNSLKESSLIFSPLSISSNLDYLFAINALAEATNKMLEDEEKPKAYEYLLLAIKALRDNQDPYKVVICYIGRLLKLSGLSLEINRCVRCGSKADIVGFSFIEGGFICQNCLQEDDTLDLINPAMITFRNIVGSPDFKFNNINEDQEIYKLILNKICFFIIDSMGVELQSLRTIL